MHNHDTKRDLHPDHRQVALRVERGGRAMEHVDLDPLDVISFRSASRAAS